MMWSDGLFNVLMVPIVIVPFCFHIVEICGGIGSISKAGERFGWRSLSLELKLGWDVLDESVFLRLIWICLSGRCFFLMLEPPCTKMLLARKPG